MEKEGTAQQWELQVNNHSLAELSGVTKRFGRLQALDELDLDVRSGELPALLGPNGAGKTTAISLPLGLQQPDSGSAYLFGQSPNRLDARRRVGVMMQEAVNWLQYMLLPVPVSAVVKGAMVFCGALGISWSLASAIRRIPAVARFV